MLLIKINQRELEQEECRFFPKLWWEKEIGVTLITPIPGNPAMVNITRNHEIELTFKDPHAVQKLEVYFDPTPQPIENQTTLEELRQGLDEILQRIYASATDSEQLDTKNEEESPLPIGAEKEEQNRQTEKTANALLAQAKNLAKEQKEQEGKKVWEYTHFEPFVQTSDFTFVFPTDVKPGVYEATIAVECETADYKRIASYHLVLHLEE